MAEQPSGLSPARPGRALSIHPAARRRRCRPLPCAAPRPAFAAPLLLCAATLLLCAATLLIIPAGTGLASPAHQRLLVVSFDGLYPDAYLDPASHDLEIPNLSALVEQGVAAEGMIGVFPTTSYPAHVTMITGVRPARHGVTANSFFNPARGSRDMYWFSSAIRVPTLPQVAHEAGYTVASVQWPGLADAAYLDWRIPEIWSVDPTTTSRQLCRRFATPKLIERIEERSGAAWTDARFEWGQQDQRIGDAAVALIELEQPEILFVHMVEIDHQMQTFGRDSRQGLDALERADAQLGRMLVALEQAGLREQTNVLVVSDHGFAPAHSALRPNVVLAELGLFEPPHRGDEVESWKALFQISSSSAALYLHEPTDAASRDLARRRFEELAAGRYRGLLHVIERDQLDALGAFPGAVFGLCAGRGFAFAKDLRGDFMAPTRDRAQHGYLPDWPEMRATFIAAGPDFRRGLRIPRMRMIDVAPTLATTLGVELGEQVEGLPQPGLLRLLDDIAQPTWGESH